MVLLETAVLPPGLASGVLLLHRQVHLQLLEHSIPGDEPYSSPAFCGHRDPRKKLALAAVGLTKSLVCNSDQKLLFRVGVGGDGSVTGNKGMYAQLPNRASRILG